MADREQLLREYVRRTLTEDFGGGDFGGDMGMMGYGLGGASVDPKDMYAVFIKPFTDVYHTVKGKTKEMAVSTAELLRVSVEAILTTVVPILASDYDQIFNKYESQLNKVKAEYKDIYDATWTAFKDNDVMLAAFAMYPSAMITQIAARKAPVPVIHTLDALTGGFFEKYFQRVLNVLNPDEKRSVDSRSSRGGGGGGNIYGLGGFPMGDYAGFGSNFGESLIREKTKQDQGDDGRSKIINKILHPKVMAAIEKNPRVQSMMKDARQGFREALEQLFDRAHAVAGAKDLQHLQQIVGKPIKGLDKLSKMSPDKQKQVSQQVMQSVRKAMINVYTKKLTLQAKAALKAGVPQGHPMIADLLATVKKIKSL